MTRGRTVLLGVLGAVLILAAGAAPWVHVAVTDAAGRVASSATGSQVHRVLVPLALTGAAAAFALTLVERVWRRVVAALLVVTGAAVALLAARTVAAPTVPTGTPGGVSGAGAGSVVTSAPAGPAVAVLGAVLLVVSGVLAWLRGSRWPLRASRRNRVPAAPRERSDWDALSAGEDPTREDPGDADAHPQRRP